MALVEALPPDLLICVFVHGFKGDDSTFLDFPSRLTHILTTSVSNVTVESIVFPAYETKGELQACVEHFVEWLEHQVLQKEVARAIQLGGKKGAAGSAKVVLCGHSMGGLVVADALTTIHRSTKEHEPLWPRIISVLAFDTPYLGLHPNMIKNKASEGIGYISAAHDVVTGLGALGSLGWGLGAAKESGSKGAGGQLAKTPSPAGTPKGETTSSWGKWAALGGVVAAGGAAATAYYHRDKLSFGWLWVGDHIKFVRNLYMEDQMQQRLDDILTITKNRGIVFRTFYSYLPKQGNQGARTFVILPTKEKPIAPYFVAARNSQATDEISAHIGMFDAKTNDGYYELGLRTSDLVQEAIFSLLDHEKTMHVDGSTSGMDQAEELARNAAEVEKDGADAGANVQPAKPEESDLPKD